MTPGRTAELLPIILGSILLLLLLYLVFPALSPLLVLAGILFLLYPVREQFAVRRILWLAVFAFLAWFVRSLIGVLTPFLIAFLIAYVFDPVVGALSRKGLPRWFSSLLVMFFLAGLLATFLILLIPILATQSQSIIDGLSGLIQSGAEFFRSGRLEQFLIGTGIPADQVQEFLSKQVPERVASVARSLLDGVVGFATNVSTMISQIVNLVIIPFIAYYGLKDYPRILSGGRDLLPPERRQVLTDYFGKVDRLIGRYLRGVLLVSLIQGILTTLGLLILGVHYALVLGMLTGILNLVPYVGFYSSLGFAVVAAAFSGDSPGMQVMSVVILYVGLNLLETVVWTPKIVGSTVGLHPVLMILSLVVFGYFLGFVGLLIAVPVTALILMSVKEWKLRLRPSGGTE